MPFLPRRFLAWAQAPRLRVPETGESFEATGNRANLLTKFGVSPIHPGEATQMVTSKKDRLALLDLSDKAPSTVLGAQNLGFQCHIPSSARI